MTVVSTDDVSRARYTLLSARVTWCTEKQAAVNLAVAAGSVTSGAFSIMHCHTHNQQELKKRARTPCCCQGLTLWDDFPCVVLFLFDDRIMIMKHFCTAHDNLELDHFGGRTHRFALILSQVQYTRKIHVGSRA